MRSGRASSALGLTSALLTAVACSAGRGTERVFNGQTVNGRYIAAEAYAAYAEGAYREAHGDWRGAELAYHRALLRDGQSPQIFTRLGVIACRQSWVRALRHFERASVLEDYAPAWTERARCLSAQRQPAAALQAALRGLTLDPRGAEINLLVVRLYREQAKLELARVWLFGWLLLEPELGDWAGALRHEADLLQDGPLSALVEHELEGRAARAAPSGAAAAGNRQAPAELIAALRSGELAHARQLASEAGVLPIQVSLLATTNARPDLGLAQAELLLDANPKDSAALVAGLLGAALLDDERPFRRLLARAQADASPPLELASALSNLLRARVGDEAADSWREAYMKTVASPAPPHP